MRESMEFDVVIGDGGPAGLAAVIRLKQINAELCVCLIEKGSGIGARILSGAVMGSHLGKQVEAKFNLRADSDPQTYALGIKELWEVHPKHFEKCLVMRAFGRWM